jgi:hypothetical protein
MASKWKKFWKKYEKATGKENQSGIRKVFGYVSPSNITKAVTNWGAAGDELEAEKEFEESREEQQARIDEREKEQKKAEETVNKIFEEWPQLADNQPFIDELEKSLNQAGTTLGEVYKETKKTGGTYLNKLSSSLSQTKKDLKRSEETAQKGFDQGLGRLKDLSKRGMPGYETEKDMLGETTAQALSDIKKLGGGKGLSSLVNIYKNEMDRRRDLGLSNLAYKTQAQQDLASAEMQSGATMADIIAGNAATSANISSTLYGAQSDYLNKLATAKTNIAQQEASKAGIMYDVGTQNQRDQYLYNELAPTQAKLDFEREKYRTTDPFAYQMQFLGEESGFAWANIATAREERQRNNEMLMKLGIEGAKFAATGGTSSIGNFLSFNSTPNTGYPAQSNYSLPSVNNYLQWPK